MSEDNWFFEEDGRQQGPVPAEALKAKLNSGALSRDNLVWKEGLPEWMAAGKTDLCEGNDFSPEPTTPRTPPPTPRATPPPQPNVFTPRKCQLNANYNFSVRKTLGRSWNLMASDFWPMVGFFALAFIIYNVAANLVIPTFFMYYPIIGGYMYYTLKRLRGEPADIEIVFDGFRRRFGSLSMITMFFMFPLFFMIIFITIGLALALPLLIETGSEPWIIGVIISLITIVTFIPISILSIVTCIATLLCLDCDIDWKHAFGQSWRAFKKHPVKLTLVSLLFGFLTQLGFLGLVVGIFVTGAWITVAYSCLYQQMFGENQV